MSADEGLSRRALLAGLAGLGVAGVTGAVGWAALPERYKTRLGLGPDPYIPDAPVGQVRLESVRSDARGRDVDLFTAVPQGHGDGAGLPVVVVLHGASGRPNEYAGFGLPQFLTAAVQAGTPPFVLAGADGGTLSWSPQPDGDDPQRMALEEMPRWLDERGFDAARRALWGWSMGGFGALQLIEQDPSYARRTAAFSPAISSGDPVFAASNDLRPRRLGVWCGEQDPLYPAVLELVNGLPTPPAVASFSPGAHTRVYWNGQTLDAFAFLGGAFA